MKILITHDDKSYLVDTEKLKPLSVIDAVMAARDGNLLVANVSSLDDVKTTASKTGPDPKVVRAWCEEQGITVNAQGRVPQDIVRKYLAAHS